MAALSGTTVLVTRPVHQAERLCALVEQAGGEAIRFPAVEIIPAGNLAAIAARLGPIEAWDLVIFISVNAVTNGLALLGERPPRLAAIGPTTAAALREQGHPVVVTPPQGYTSEDLLTMPELSEVAGQRILIVRGEGGRETLGRELVARQAEVAYAEVYRRARPTPPPGETERLEARWADGEIHFVTATSVETLTNLHAMLGPRGHAALRATPLVTASERVVKKAARLGLAGTVSLAAAPGDEALVEAMCESRREIARQARSGHSNE